MSPLSWLRHFEIVMPAEENARLLDTDDAMIAGKSLTSDAHTEY